MNLDADGNLQGTTSELLKDIITIFYTPLAQVYKAASIADSLGDLQNFINDLIRTVEQIDERESMHIITKGAQMTFNLLSGSIEPTPNRASVHRSRRKTRTGILRIRAQSSLQRRRSI